MHFVYKAIDRLCARKGAEQAEIQWGLQGLFGKFRIAQILI